MSKRRIFISYRRDDAAGFCHAIHDRLIEHLSKDQVFMDVLGIEPGSDFVSKLESTLGNCDVVLAFMGKRWAGDTAPQGAGIHNPKDWVRMEIASAFRQGIRVIPVLLDGATMPKLESLPEELRQLVRINAVDVRTSRLNADVWDLTGTAVVALGGKWPPDEPGGRIYAVLSILYALFAGGVVIFVMLASMFMAELQTATLAGTLLFVLNAIVVLRLPVHHWVRTLSRERALKIGAVAHLVAFFVMGSGTGDLEAGMIILFGIIPAASLFLGSFAMRRVVRS